MMTRRREPPRMTPTVRKVTLDAEGCEVVSAARTGTAVEVGMIVVVVRDWIEAVRREVTKEGVGVDDGGRLAVETTVDEAAVEMVAIVEGIGMRMVLPVVGATLVKRETLGTTT
jgi:hypothetical protein